jgi:glucose-6-phosphate dehydrogenase assembly protein OpcA
VATTLTDASTDAILRELAALRVEGDANGAPEIRTNVMTHLAWVPSEWLDAARATLEGFHEQHPSRTIILVPDPGAEDRLDATVDVHRYAIEGSTVRVATDVVELTLGGSLTDAPASLVWPLLISDLPVFLRWRARPRFDSPEFEQLVGVTDRLIVDSTEWDDLPASYAGLVPFFERAAVSDIAWARTGRWRALLASLWPELAEVGTIRVRGTLAQAHLLGGWLGSRLDHEVAVEHEAAERLEGIDLDGEPAPFPPGDPPSASDLLSAELDCFSRDPVYEAAVRAAAS